MQTQLESKLYENQRISRRGAFAAAFLATFLPLPPNTNGYLAESKVELVEELEFGDLKAIEKQQTDRARQEALLGKWQLSTPIAGRMINADPVFTQDER